MNNLLAQIAVFPGFVHRVEFLPCQDAAGFHTVRDSSGTITAMATGVTDGAGSKYHSQVGAELAAQLAPKLLCDLVRIHGVHNAQLIGKRLQKSLLRQLTGLIWRQPGGPQYMKELNREKKGGQAINLDNPLLAAIDAYVMDYFLFTILVGYMSDEGVQAHRRGDGGLVIDQDPPDFLHYQGQEGAPYLGYDLISPSSLAARLAQESVQIKDGPDFASWYYPNARRLALFTDGVDLSKLDEVWDYADPPDRWHTRRNMLYCVARDWSLESTNPYDDLAVAVMINNSE